MFCVFRETCVWGFGVFYACVFYVKFEYMNTKVTLLTAD